MSDALPAVRDTGDGPPVLFLHAFPLDSSQWDHQVAALSDHYRCLRPDFWGCAASSPPPDGEPSLDAYADAVLRALDALGVTRFRCVASSLGGYVAFSIVRQAAARLAAAVFAATRAGADGEPARDDRLATARLIVVDDSVERLVEPNVARLLGPGARAEVHVSDPLRGRIRRWTPAGAAYALRAMAVRPDSTEDARTWDAPALVIAGRDDAVIPVEDTESLRAALRRPTLVTMDCGHLPNIEQPVVFTEHVRRFLETTDGDA